jgi:AraC-like DNA-binding protein
MKTCMDFIAGNVARVAHGSRTYGLKPVFPLARSFWELEWVFEGNARQTNVTSETPVGNAPCLYVSHPDSPHGWTDEGTAKSQVFVLHFRSAPAELLAVVKPAKTFVMPLKSTEVRRHRKWLDAACRLHADGDPRWRIHFEQILLAVTLEVMERAGPVACADGPADRVKAALQWYEENIGDNPSADDVAKAVGVTRGHLRRMFLDAGRNAPKMEFARLRMTVAQRCLIAGWKLDRIATYLGFSEASALSRSFLAVCGRSPRRWLAESPERARPGELT